MILFENTCAPVHAESTQLKTQSLSKSMSLSVCWWRLHWRDLHQKRHLSYLPTAMRIQAPSNWWWELWWWLWWWFATSKLGIRTATKRACAGGASTKQPTRCGTLARIWAAKWTLQQTLEILMKVGKCPKRIVQLGSWSHFSSYLVDLRTPAGRSSCLRSRLPPNGLELEAPQVKAFRMLSEEKKQLCYLLVSSEILLEPLS